MAEERLLWQAKEPSLGQDAYCGRGALTAANRGTLTVARRLWWQRNHVAGGRALTVVGGSLWQRGPYCARGVTPTVAGGLLWQRNPYCGKQGDLYCGKELTMATEP